MQWSCLLKFVPSAQTREDLPALVIIGAWVNASGLGGSSPPSEATALEFLANLVEKAKC